MNVSTKTFCIFAVCLQLLVAVSAVAHPGHENVLSEKQAILRGKAIVASIIKKQELIDDQSLDDSWKQATDYANCKETPEYYRIAFDNRDAGKTLYILLTVAGKYLRANFDGQFADLTFSSFPVQDCT